MTNEGKHYGRQDPRSNRQPRTSERAGGGMKGRPPGGICRRVAGVFLLGVLLNAAYYVALAAIILG